ncbi:MAB_1171c family putative transporter [Micromonospora haikouensis]|uniref:MAB_1171c family putative transporter n=1 Tax=Micromonospora haikouensis TaxID=686309 RepID=UPI003D731274
MIVNILFILCSSAAFIAAGYKIRDLRATPGDPAMQALVAGLIVLGIGVASATPLIYTPLNHLVGVPNLFRLITHLAMIAFSVAFTIMRLYVAYDPDQAGPRARRRVVGYLAAAAVMIALFAAAPVDEDRVDWTIYYGDEPLVVAYLITYLATFGSALFEIARLSHRTGGFLPKGHLRTGMKLTEFGAAFGMSYCLYKALYLAAKAAELRPPAPLAWINREDLISPLLAVPGALLIIIGLTLPSWLPALRAASGTITAYRAYRDLLPLWQDLYQAEPEILFGEYPPSWPAPAQVNRLLARRAIEIPDGLLRLADFYDPDVQARTDRAARARGLAGDDLRAAVTAACLRDALAARAAGRRPATPAALETADTATREDQIAWLRQVAVAYRKPSPADTAPASQPASA